MVCLCQVPDLGVAFTDGAAVKLPLTGRTRCAEPNLKNIPIRTPEGPFIRQHFVSRLALLGFDGRTASSEPFPDLHTQMAAIFGGKP